MARPARSTHRRGLFGVWIARITRRAGRALCHRPVRLFAGVNGLDIGISPAAPAVDRRHPGKVPGAWDRLFGRGLPGSLPDEFDLMQRADHGIQPAGLDPRHARDSGNPPRWHVSET